MVIALVILTSHANLFRNKYHKVMILLQIKTKEDSSLCNNKTDYFTEILLMKIHQRSSKKRRTFGI